MLDERYCAARVYSTDFLDISHANATVGTVLEGWHPQQRPAARQKQSLRDRDWVTHLPNVKENVQKTSSQLLDDRLGGIEYRDVGITNVMPKGDGDG